MPLISVDPRRFGFGGSNLTPQTSAGIPSLGAVLEAAREDVFFSRFDWSTITQAAATDLASLVALINVITPQMFALAPVGTDHYGVGDYSPAPTDDGVLVFMVSQCNALKAALVNTGSVDYSALSGTPDASDLATAITLANAIRTALGIS